MAIKALLALLALAAVGACTAIDPAVQTAEREDLRCRRLGAVPENPTYVQCRQQAVEARDVVYAQRLAAEAAVLAEAEAKTAQKKAPSPSY